MNKTTKIFAITAIVAALGTGAVGIGTTFAAQNATESPEKGRSGLISWLAEKFNLETTDVQAIFDEFRDQKQVNFQARYEAFLDQAVLDGELTQEQADSILGKHTEIKNFREGLRGQTPEEIQSAMESEREDLKQWAADNNVPERFLRFGRGPGAGRGPGRGMMHRGFENEDLNDGEIE
jgi:hypothetical protein